MTGKLNRIDRAIIVGGLAIVAVAGILFAAFPLYRMLDNSSVRRPLWNPPSVVIREPGQGLKAEDIARMEKDPRQAELLKGLKEGITYWPKPAWLGFREVDLNNPVPVSRQFPTNSLLYVLIATIAGYVYALKRRGII